MSGHGRKHLLRVPTVTKGLLAVRHKSGFTGEKEDSIGRNRCYSDGKQVSCATGVDNPIPPDRIEASGEPKPTGAESMNEKKPWELTQEEYSQTYRDNPSPEARKVLKDRGFVGGYDEQVFRAVKEGIPVPDYAVNGSVMAIRYLMNRDLKIEFGEDYVKLLEKNAAKIIPDLPGEIGKPMTFRPRQSGPNSFDAYEKDQILVMGGKPVVVSKAGKLQKVKGDGGVYGYFQEVTVREPKPKEAEKVRKAVLAAEALPMQKSVMGATAASGALKDKSKRVVELTKEALKKDTE